MIQHFVDKQNEMALEGYTINHGRDMQIVTQLTWKYLIQAIIALIMMYACLLIGKWNEIASYV